VKDSDLDEGTPDHPGEPLETAELSGNSAAGAKPSSVGQALPSPAHAGGDAHVVPAAMRQPLPGVASDISATRADTAKAPENPNPAQSKLASTGTVVLDVEQGGIEVPSFLGKTVRGAIEAAQDAGLELEAVGSGIARQQSPAAGTHLPAGSRVTVQFER